jgi:nitronate monooxygenase
MTAKLRPLTIKGKTLRLPIIQGGMGVGVSLYPLASAVAQEGGAGIVSSACLDRLVTKRTGKKHNAYEAAFAEVTLAKAQGGIAGINIMVALQGTYEDSVRGALDAGADLIISGAGLPLKLPVIQAAKDTALLPIVSSAKALTLICKKWERLGARPDAVILEGPLAGGHLGFREDSINLESNRLEVLLPQVKEAAKQFGSFPVIAAGGIYTHEDIVRIMDMGADGVQMGTRFLATLESSATAEYKQAVVEATSEDIQIAKPGSPCGLPFRVLKCSPALAPGWVRPARCDKGYVLMRGPSDNLTECLAKESCIEHFCICNSLLSSAGYNPDTERPVYTVGTTANRVDRIMSVKELMKELSGE